MRSFENRDYEVKVERAERSSQILRNRGSLQSASLWYERARANHEFLEKQGRSACAQKPRGARCQEFEAPDHGAAEGRAS